MLSATYAVDLLVSSVAVSIMFLSLIYRCGLLFNYALEEKLQ